MYSAIVEKCPAVKNTTIKGNPLFTKDCKKWKLSVNDGSEDYKKCMLYYDSLIFFCTKLGNELTQRYGDLFTLNLKKYKVDLICNEFPNEKLLREKYNVTDFTQCIRLCFNDGVFDDRCKYAHYYLKFNTTKLKADRKGVLETYLNNSVVKTPQEVSDSKSDTNDGKARTETAAGSPTIESNLPINLSEQKANTIPEKGSPEKSGQDNKKVDVAQTGQDKKDDAEINKNNIEDIDNLEDNAPNPLGVDKSADMEGEFEPDDEDSLNEQEHVENNAELNVQTNKAKPNTVEDESVNNFNTTEDEMDGDSYFFSYFTVLMCLCIVGYVGYHNRQKILALILEGKRGRRSSRGRRPNSINYHKLDSNLEEAISSSCPKGSTNVIY
ncbi:hypothetical protein GWI33_004547 [Rhynchophorus ferrugineus]|uniref:Uncharacterized protein n=1 Tax=Rhynchophorus ferrugineus TaxID=354439 RepID=A0A834MIN7_RHYFE|nr:hypothetical protein GWI33_004547 [Rhynchophorus ferrugineus]